MTPLRYIATLILLVSAATAFAQDSDAQDGARIEQLFRGLSKATRWNLVSETKMRFRTYHPQGMAIVGDKIYLSSVEAKDRRNGIGVGRVFEVDLEGKLLRTVEVGEGAMYHPGGMDYDGLSLWVSVAEYRPDSASLVYMIWPKTMEAQRVFGFQDHLGAVVHETTKDTLVAVSWGSRKFFRWFLPQTPEQERLYVADILVDKKPNPNHYIDYQDVQWLRGTRYALFGGLSRYRRPGRDGTSLALGGVDLVNLDTLQPEHQLPIPLWTKGGLPMTQNPFYIQLEGGKLRFYFMPEDDESTLYVYEAD